MEAPLKSEGSLPSHSSSSEAVSLLQRIEGDEIFSEDVLMKLLPLSVSKKREERPLLMKKIANALVKSNKRGNLTYSFFFQAQYSSQN